MCKHGNEVVLNMPNYIDVLKTNRSIACDFCIVEVIRQFWIKRIDTLGCCCGHGKQNPSIVISDGYNDDGIVKIKALIAEIDDRDWDIMQWRIIKV